MCEHELQVAGLRIERVPLHLKPTQKLYIINTAHDDRILFSLVDIYVLTQESIDVESTVLLLQNRHPGLFVILGCELGPRVLEYDPWYPDPLFLLVQ